MATMQAVPFGPGEYAGLADEKNQRADQPTCERYISDLSDDQEQVFKDLPQDAFGMTIVIVIRDLTSILTCSANRVSVVRTLFVLCAIVVNLTLQLVVLWNVNHFIVGQAIHHTQKDYQRYHKEVFNADGSFAEDKWKGWTGPAMELCNLAVSKSIFTTAIIFLWTGRMLGELRDIERLHRNIHNIRAVPHASDMISSLDSPQTHCIGLTSPARFALYVLVVIPKIVIAIFLVRIGCAWLAATESFSELILNALALEFVIDVDELIYKHFAPQVMHEYLTKFKIVHFKQRVQEDADWEELMAYFRSFGYMFLCGAWAYVFINHIQQVIPGFKHDIDIHCGDWFTKKYQPLCPPELWPLKSGDCFPFGNTSPHN